MPRHDDYDPESEVGAPAPIIHNHYSQNRNGNGAVNKVVWAIAGFAIVCLVTINGVMWSKLWDMAASQARLEAQMVIVLQRLPPP